MYVCMHAYRFVILTADMNLKLISCHKGKGADDFNRLINEGSTLPFTYIHTYIHTCMHTCAYIYLYIMYIKYVTFHTCIHTYNVTVSHLWKAHICVIHTFLVRTIQNTNSVSMCCMYVCMYVGTVQAAPEAIESAKVAASSSPNTAGAGKGDFGTSRCSFFLCMYMYVCMYVYVTMLRHVCYRYTIS